MKIHIGKIEAVADVLIGIGISEFIVKKLIRRAILQPSFRRMLIESIVQTGIMESAILLAYTKWEEDRVIETDEVIAQVKEINTKASAAAKFLSKVAIVSAKYKLGSMSEEEAADELTKALEEFEEKWPDLMSHDAAADIPGCDDPDEGNEPEKSGSELAGDVSC